MPNASPPTTFDADRYNDYQEQRRLRASLETKAKSHRCARCKGRLNVAFIEGEDRLRCACFPDDLPAPVKWGAKQQDDERRGRMVESALANRDPAVRDMTIAQVKELINPKATPTQAQAFVLFCQSADLNPWLKEVHLVFYGDQPAIVVGIDGVIKKAAESPEYKYFDSGVICQAGEQAHFRSGSFMLPGDKLIGAWCNVHIKGKAAPMEIRINLEEWSKGQANWKSMPAHMIEKSAIKLGLRRAFPNVDRMLREESELEVLTEDQVLPEEGAEVEGEYTEVVDGATGELTPLDTPTLRSELKKLGIRDFNELALKLKLPVAKVKAMDPVALLKLATNTIKGQPETEGSAVTSEAMPPKADDGVDQMFPVEKPASEIDPPAEGEPTPAQVNLVHYLEGTWGIGEADVLKILEAESAAQIEDLDKAKAKVKAHMEGPLAGEDLPF